MSKTASPKANEITVELLNVVTGKKRIVTLTWEELDEVMKKHQEYLNQQNSKKN